MEVANVRLRLNKVGSDVPKTDVTPAEAVLIHALHGPYNGGMTFGEEFEKITVVGTAKVATDKFKTVIDVKAQEAVYETQVIEPAVSQVGTVGQPGFVACKNAVTKEVLVKPAVEEVSHEEPVLRDRTDVEELNRLRSKYNARNKENKLIVDVLWPDKLNPKFPATFKDIKWQEIASVGAEAAALNYVTGQVAAK